MTCHDNLVGRYFIRIIYKVLVTRIHILMCKYVMKTANYQKLIFWTIITTTLALLPSSLSPTISLPKVSVELLPQLPYLPILSCPLLGLLIQAEFVMLLLFLLYSLTLSQIQRGHLLHEMYHPLLLQLNTTACFDDKDFCFSFFICLGFDLNGNSPCSKWVEPPGQANNWFVHRVSPNYWLGTRFK